MQEFFPELNSWENFRNSQKFQLAQPLEFPNFHGKIPFYSQPKSRKFRMGRIQKFLWIFPSNSQKKFSEKVGKNVQNSQKILNFQLLFFPAGIFFFGADPNFWDFWYWKFNFFSPPAFQFSHPEFRGIPNSWIYPGFSNFPKFWGRIPSEEENLGIKRFCGIQKIREKKFQEFPKLGILWQLRRIPGGIWEKKKSQNSREKKFCFFGERKNSWIKKIPWKFYLDAPKNWKQLPKFFEIFFFWEFWTFFSIFSWHFGNFLGGIGWKISKEFLDPSHPKFPWFWLGIERDFPMEIWEFQLNFLGILGIWKKNFPGIELRKKSCNP